MRFLWYLILGAMLICCTIPLAAQDNTSRQSLLDEGAAAYQQRDFARAITAWEAFDLRQINVYYNLARAYEYQGEWGDARVNDRLAQAFQEKYYFGAEDVDLDAALERGWARQAIETLHPLVWLKQQIEVITQPLGWGILGALLWSGSWLMLIVYVRRRAGGWLLLTLGIGSILWFVVLGGQAILASQLPEAVSVETTPIYSGPGSDYVVLTTWAEGYDLYMLETRGDWVRVMRADGMSGWLEAHLILPMSSQADEL